MSEPHREVIYRGHKVDVVLQPIRLASGLWDRREVVVHPGAVAILPLVDADHFCLIRNHRYTIERTLHEVPAGTLEPGEDPDIAATRELQEETGYRARRIRKLAEFYPSPGVLTELMHLYLAESLEPGPTRLQPDERIEPMVVSVSDAFAMLERGEIRDAKSIVAILLYDRLRRAPATDA